MRTGRPRSPVWTSEIHTFFGEGAMWLLLGCLRAEDDDDRRAAEDRLREMAERGRLT